MFNTSIELTKQHFKDSNWESLIDPDSETECHQYMSIFKTKANEIDDINDPIKEVLIVFNAICSFALEYNQEEVTFKPMFSSANGRSPIPEDIPEQHWLILPEIIGEIHNPEIKARICDLLWSYKKNHVALNLAIEAYIETSKIYLSGKYNPVHAIQRIQRAIKLSRYNRPIRQDLVKFINNEIAQNNFSKENNPVIFLSLIKTLIELKESNLEIYIEELKNIATTTSNTLLEEDLYITIHSLLPQDSDEFINNTYLILAAKTYLKEAIKATQREIPSYMAACNFLTKAIAAFRRTKNDFNKQIIDKEVGTTQKLLSDYQPKVESELKTISTEFDITEVVIKAQEFVSNKSIHEALFCLTQMISTKSEQDYNNMVLDEFSQSPIRFICHTSKLNSKGQTIGSIPPLMDFKDNSTNNIALKYHSFFHLRLDISSICTAHIQPALRQIHNEHKVSLQTFLQVVANNPFVEPGRELIYANGLLAGFNNDLLTSTHLLIPQLEHSLRFVLQQHGETTTTLEDSRQFEKELSLDDLFRRKSETLKSIFEEKFLFLFDYLLVSPLGANLRNLFAHGLIESNEFYSPECLYLWAFALK